MSMLAERRRKQKWSLNPRGKFWAEDSNKFGQKLMEKMGWSAGKGLGAKENGMTEHIKVSYKNDSQGVGYKETDEQWTETQADFKAVLEALAGENQTTDELKLSSLEQKSEGSKVRVHYKKFTRGKDLSRRTAKDLACIFGKKNLKGAKKSEAVAPKSDDVEDKEDNKQFSNAGLMSDYFSKKLPSFGKVGGYVIGNNGVLKKADDGEEQCERRPAFASSIEENAEESECEIKPHFGFGFQQTVNESSSCETVSFVSSKTNSLKASFVSYISESSKDNDDSIKKKKKSKRALDDSKNDSPIKKTKLEPDDSVTPKKQKSKKNKDDSGIANPAFEPMYSSVKVEKHVLESIEESVLSESLMDTKEKISEAMDDSIKKKKKKKLTLDNGTSIEDTPTKKPKLEPQLSENNAVTKKQKSKKNKEDSGLANPAFDPMYSSVKVEKHVLESIEESVLSESLNDSIAEVAETLEVQAQINNEVTPIKLKSDPEKRKKKTNASYGEGSPEKQASVNECEEIETPKKKKRTTVEDIATPEDVNSEQSKKKKKFKRDFTEETEDFMDVSNKDLETSYSETEKKSRKKDKFKNALNSQLNASEENSFKKKKTKKHKEGVDNPLFSVGVENDNSVTEEQNAFEIHLKPKKKNKSKESVGVENPIFHCNDSVNSQDLPNEEYEIRRKEKSKKKKRKDTEETKGLDNPALNLEASIDESCDLLLNVVTTPIQPTENYAAEDLSIQRVRKVERRKSVRFSDVTRERIIPSKEEMQNEELDCSRDIVEFQGKLNDSSDLTYLDTFVPKKKSKKKAKGVENGAFDQYACNIEETIDSVNQKLNNYQAEIENDMNEAKMKSVEIEDIMIGDVGNPDGTDEKLPDGSVKLKFKNANFRRRAKFMDSLTGPKKSYTHLIKGDIVVGFNECNLHEIKGYGMA